MDNKKLIRKLRDIAILLEIKGENPFKSRTYRLAAEKIDNENIDIEKVVKDSSLGDIKGFGKALVSKITDYVENGEMEYYSRLTSEIPESLIKLTYISNIGSKKAKLLYETLSITNVDELEVACKQNKVAQIKGFAEKSQEMILNSIEHRKAGKGRFIQQGVKKEALEILAILKSMKSVLDVDISGDVRRFTETIKQIYFIVASDSNIAFENELKDKIKIEKKNGFYNSKTSQGVPICIELVKPQEFPIALLKSTGNNDFVESFRKYLTDKEFELKEYNILKNEQALIFKSEVHVFESLDIQFIPPELRDNKKVLQLGIERKVPNLIQSSDLKGMIHVHSNWTDGRDSILDMALRTKELGFEYMVLCDHSQSAVYANGLTPERVKLQQKEIEHLNKEDIGIKILKGIESDILKDGSLDYKKEILESFDIVVASIHSGFRMSKSDMTKRIVKALKNPYTTILGHPTGRLLLVRPEYELDIKQIIDCAADFGKVIEINSNPYRLDLSWQNAIYAKEKGAKIAINPDSHRTESLENVYIGVNVAKKSGLEAKDVVNCLQYEELLIEISR